MNKIYRMVGAGLNLVNSVNPVKSSFFSRRRLQLLVEMKDFVEIDGNGTVVRIGEHEILHVSPPATADFRFGDLPPQLFRFDFRISKESISLAIHKYSVIMNAVFPENLLQLGPDRIVTPFVLVLISRPESHQERFTNHLQLDLCALFFVLCSLCFVLCTLYFVLCSLGLLLALSV
jgi:hypothetical protein